MRISIITVVYNNERTLESAILSVLNQSFKNIEYIIIDGKSIDGTIKIINSYKDKIAHFISETDEGIYDAMNKGIALASGDVIGILNSDDLYADDDVLKDVMGYFQADEKLDILYGDLVYVNTDDINKVVRKWTSKKYYKKFFEHGNVPPHTALFVKKNIYNECGLFNVDYKLAADYDFMLRIFKKFGFSSKYISRLMVRMRLGGATNKSLSNIIKGNKEILNIWKSNNLKVPLLLMPYRLFKRLIQFI